MTDFDPTNVKDYYGIMFKTGSGSTYRLTEAGKFKGRPSIEDAEIKLIAGVEREQYHVVLGCFDTRQPWLKDKLDKYLKDYGKEPAPGLHLVVSLTSEAVKEKNRHGLITSPIVAIE